MGFDKKSLTKKCGEILLNLKPNKKSKVYTFNCAFCNANYDQLKKFSFHLDEKHSQNFCEEPSQLLEIEDELEDEQFKEDELMAVDDEQLKEDEQTAVEDVKENLEMFVPGMKEEELMETEQPAEENTGKVFSTNYDNVGEDPLMMKESIGRRPTLTKLRENADDAEYEEAYNFNYEGDENNDFKESEIESASECRNSDEEDKIEPIQIKKARKTRKPLPNKKSRASDQDVEEAYDFIYEVDEDNDFKESEIGSASESRNSNEEDKIEPIQIKKARKTRKPPTNKKRRASDQDEEEAYDFIYEGDENNDFKESKIGSASESRNSDEEDKIEPIQIKKARKTRKPPPNKKRRASDQDEDEAYDFNCEGDEDNDFKESEIGSATESRNSDEEDKIEAIKIKKARKTRKPPPNKKRRASDQDEDEAYDINCEGDEGNDFKESEIGSATESRNSDEEDKIEPIKIKKARKTRKPPPNKKRCASDQDDSHDADFNVEIHSENKPKRKYRFLMPKTNVDEKLLITTILEELQKQSVLWDLKDRSREKTVCQTAYEALTMEVNKKLKIKIKWQCVRKQIKDLRNSYSSELEKQQKGEPFEMPWYAENMKFLKENIDALLQNRNHKKKYNRLKTLDESHIPILIDYYKNCEILWEVTNIEFYVKPRRIEAFNVIIEDLRENHNIDITLDELQKRFKFLNRIFSTDREKELQWEADEIEFVPTSIYYEDLAFLCDSQGPFKCPHCGEVIKKLNIYQIHLGEHDNNRPFKCNLCGLDFEKYNVYVIHAKRHLGVHSYHCDICGKGFTLKIEWERHCIDHTNEEPYLCEICGAGFKSWTGHDNHVRRHEKRFRYECHICKQGFNQLHILKTHLKVHLNIRDILCNICGKGFTAMRHLRHHQLVHSDEKKYKCLTCGKAYSQLSGLRGHRKLHPSCNV